MDAYAEISDEELSALTNAIKVRYGFDFTNYETKSLKRGFARLIGKHQLGSLIGLWSKILKDRDFMLNCMDDLTVNLTEMFRNPEVWVKLKQEAIERSKSKLFLNFWHAGCSTGEEIYTMAIILKGIGQLHKAKTWATDLSSTALSKAMEGEYPRLLWKKYLASFLQYFPNGNLNDYFVIGEENIKIKDDLKKHVRFQRHNLVQDPADRKYDFIFCRNVMIYFDDSLKMKVLKLFHDALEEDGLFIIGYYDMLPEQSKELFTLHDPQTRIYKKSKGKAKETLPLSSLLKKLEQIKQESV